MRFVTYGDMEEDEARTHTPKVVFVDGKNRIVELTDRERPGPEMPRRVATSFAVRMPGEGVEPSCRFRDEGF